MIAAFTRLFGEGFRVFFLAAGLYAVFVLVVWTGWLGGAHLAVALPPTQWHAHELIFGFGTAALGGFFLTAVPNWTGAKAARHAFIAAAAGVWLAGRIAVWFSGALPPVAVAVVDLAFLPLLAAKIATQLIRRPKPANVMFLGLLALIWIADLLVHLDWTGLARGTVDAGMRAGLYGLCAMIAVLGGRVTPAFTRNALARSGRETDLPVSRRGFEASGVALAIALPIAVLIGLPAAAIGAVALACGLAQLARLAGWRTAAVLDQPILWSLHLAFAMLGLGYLLTGLAAFGLGDPVAPLHVLGIGAVGGMTLAVMSRATLGHSGRPLVAPPGVALAYGLLPVAAALRWWSATLPGPWSQPALILAGTLWIAAFALFVVALWPAFWGPRAAATGE